MKQIYIEKQAKDQVHQIFGDTNSKVHCSIMRVPPNSDFLNIFLIQNKGKGPPGDIRYPEHPPDSEAGTPDITPDRVQNPVGGGAKTDLFPVPGEHTLKNPSNRRSLSLSKGETNLNTEIKRFNKIQNSNFLQTLNFTNMKKQILFLAFFVLAVLVGTNNVFAQKPDLSAIPTVCPTPAPVDATCIDADALHPVPGTDYEYTVEVPTPTTGTKTYNWFVTQDPDIMDVSTLTTAIELGDGSGTHIQAIGTTTGGGTYNNATNGGTETIWITWKSFTHDAAVPVFLVIYVENDDCSTDNIEVYIIEPKHAFTLDIVPLAIDGTVQAEDYETCVSKVVSAKYNGTIVEMDYGVNYLYYIVTAANFTKSWQPSFQTGGVAIVDSREVTAVDWAYSDEADAAAGWHVMTTADNVTWTTTTENVEVHASGTNTVGAVGECIVVRVEVDNNQAESIVDASVTLAVDGVMEDPGTAGSYADNLYSDISDADCSDDGFTEDVSQQILAPRPDINEVTPVAPAFVPTNRD